jgi:hypothetical protein
MRLLLTLLLSSSDGGTALELRALTIASGFDDATVDRYESDAFFGHCSATQRSVRVGKVWRRVVELTPTKRRTLDGYLGAWRGNHGCTADEVRGVTSLTRRGVRPPQLTFGGSCEGGDTYLLRVILLEGVAYELHVDTSVMTKVELRGELEDLLSRVELK